MKYTVILSLFFLTLISCSDSGNVSSSITTDNDELYQAIADAEPGDNIVMANGVWKDLELKLTKSGTENKPIILSAETPGKVIIQGESNLQISGDYITVEGLYFTDGHSPSNSVISFSIADTVANHCRVTNCVIKDYNKKQRNHSDLWVLIKGRHNQLDHCYLAGKSNRGPTCLLYTSPSPRD